MFVDFEQVINYQLVEINVTILHCDVIVEVHVTEKMTKTKQKVVKKEKKMKFITNWKINGLNTLQLLD